MAAGDHVPVLLDAVMEVLRPKSGRVIVDATIGLGGHAEAFLRWGAGVVGLDLDGENLERARPRLEATLGTFELRRSNFAALPRVLAGLGLDGVDGILADLGVSSPHVDDARRGFSYRRPGPLDMRMDTTRGPTAADLVNRMGEEDLARAIRELGDEENAAKIARVIVRRRPLRTTEDLTEIVCKVRNFTLRRAAGAKLHPAARTFQALRMLVNRELPNLERLLAVIPECLKPGGGAAIISFHSGEDRRVKRAFREGLRTGVYSSVSRGAVTAETEERERNPRSRSAKLRWARRRNREG